MTRGPIEALDKTIKEIQAGRCPMPILLQGDEDYRVEEARRRIVAALFPDEADRRDAVESVSARDLDIPRIIARASETPLFASRHALIVRDAELLGKDAGAAEAEESGKSRAPRGGAKATQASGGTWARLPPDAILILVARPGLDRRTRLYKEIETVGRALIFERLKTEAEVAAWIDQRVRYRKKSLEPGARTRLVEKTFVKKEGVSLRLLALEIEKLSAYTGNRATITRADVEAVVGQTSEEQVFAITEALSEKATGRALELVGEFFEREEAALGLLALLAREVRCLLDARVLWERVPEARRATRMSFPEFTARLLPALKAAATPEGAEKPEGLLMSGHPYVAWLKLRQAERFPVPGLLAAFAHLAAADRELKSSGRPDRLIMETLVVRLARGMV